MTQREIDSLGQTLRERMDAGDRANAQRIDQIIIDRSEDRDEQRAFRQEMREDHSAVLKAINDINLAIQARGLQIEQMLLAIQRNEEWRKGHNDWHGPDDRDVKGRITPRLDSLEGRNHDRQVQGSVWAGQWRGFVAGAGVCGVVAGIVVAVLTFL